MTTRTQNNILLLALKVADAADLHRLHYEQDGIEAQQINLEHANMLLGVCITDETPRLTLQG